jgi:hypothetical protein
MKNIICILFVIALLSCNSTLQFEFPKSDKLIYCQCLFSTDAIWKVNVAYTYNFSDQKNDHWIDNARVFIVDMNKDTIRLNHFFKGEYRSENSRPKEGNYYRLFVVENGDTLSSTPCCVPSGVKFDVVEFDEKPGTVKVDYYTLNDLYSIKCNIQLNDSVAQDVLVRTFLFDSINGVAIYSFNNEVYDSLFDILGDLSIINQLQSLNGDTIYGYRNLDVVLQNLLPNTIDDSIVEKVITACYIGRTYDPKEETFINIYGYSGTSNLKNYEYEQCALLGTFQNSSIFNVYVMGDMDGEYWIECKALSPEAFKYYDGYLRQLNNRIDYSNIQDPVYSNMSNGVGIFAGFKEFLIKVK